MSELPPALAHRQGSRGLLRTWREMALVIYSNRILDARLPSYCDGIAKVFVTTDPDEIIAAVRRGDPAFFVAFLLRLDQLDGAMRQSGMSIADRSPIVRARFIVEGFRVAAEERLLAQGGSWPP